MALGGVPEPIGLTPTEATACAKVRSADAHALLPPAFHLVALDREVAAFERAVRAAPRGIDDGTVYWTERTDRLELAIVLEPETPARRALEAVYVLTVAAGEALGGLLPPGVGGLRLAGRPHPRRREGRHRAGALAPVAGPRRRPPWLVLGLALRSAAPRPGDADRTSLRRGARRAVVQLVESIAGHLLHWIGRWQAGGLDAGAVGLEPTVASGAEKSAGSSLAAGDWRCRVDGLAADGASGRRARLRSPTPWSCQEIVDDRRPPPGAQVPPTTNANLQSNHGRQR